MLSLQIFRNILEQFISILKFLNGPPLVPAISTHSSVRITKEIHVRTTEFYSVNSNTTGTITPMFSSYDWMKPNLKQKAGTARGKWLVRKDWGKLRGVKSLFLSENMLEK